MNDNFDKDRVYEVGGRVEAVVICASWYIGGGPASQARSCLFIERHISLFIRL